MEFAKFEADSRAAGTPIVPGNTLGILRGNALVLVGVDPMLATTPPKAYSKGVRVGTAYFDIPRLKPEISRGLYTLWTKVPEISLGRVLGAVVAERKDGCKYTFPARYEIRSLDVPADANGIVRLLASPAALLDPEDEDDEWCIGVEWECDNGASFCIGFTIDPTPIPEPES